MMIFPTGVFSPDGYIISQKPFDEIEFKDSTVADTGCGVIAVYNVLRRLNMSPNFSEIKNYVARNSLTTKLGTSFSNIIGYLRKKGVYGGLCFCKRGFSKVSVGILLYAHKQGLHWVAFYKDGDGFRFFNVYKGYEKEVVTMDAFLKSYSAGIIKCVIKVG